MANKPLRPCKKPGCGKLVTGGYCDQHKRPRQKDRSEQAERWHRLYGTALWKNDLRPGQLLRQPFCEECAEKGVRTKATDVDHKIDHKGELALFADPNNLRSLCHSCHSRKTAKSLFENKAKKQRQ